MAIFRAVRCIIGLSILLISSFASSENTLCLDDLCPFINQIRELCPSTKNSTISYEFRCSAKYKAAYILVAIPHKSMMFHYSNLI